MKDRSVLQIKKFIFKLIIFSFILFIFDRMMGMALENLYLGQKSGKHYRLNNTIYKTTADIVIFGSSRANRNYIPSIISEKTSLSCYNAGAQGQGILFSTAIEELVLKRYTPKIIVLNIDPEMLNKNDSFYDRLSDLYPYYDQNKEIIIKYISIKSKFEYIKLHSKIYQYNSKILHLIKYFFIPQPDYNGYRPLKGNIENLKKIDYSNIQLFYNNDPKSLDTNYINIFNKFIMYALERNIKLIFIISPNYLPIGGKSNLIKYSASFRYINSFAFKYKIPIIDISNDSSFTFNKKKFYDLTHLNNSGAILFSQNLADSLKNTIKNKL